MEAGRPDTAREPGVPLGAGALAQGVERYASMFTHHPHAAYSVDPEGYYTDANERALEMTGLTLEEMRRTNFAQVIHPEDLHLMRAGFDRAMEGEPQVVDARVVRVDGEVVDIRCTAIPVVVGGEVVGVHGVTEDVTDAKRVLRELEEAHAAKSLFLATLSHEVRTPLAVLFGATDLLMESDLDPEPHHYAQLVHRSSERLLRLVDQILQYSGLESHRAALDPRPFDLRVLVDDLVEWATPSAKARGLEFTCDMDAAVPATLEGDALRITQVVTNLVQNAITYTERGSVHLRVARATDPESDGTEAGGRTWVELSVTDTGIGIEADRLVSLFEPFTQADPHYASGRPGVGLGLSICRELTDLMDGRLEASSTPGEGSTFTFGVPLRHVEAGAATPSADR